MEILFHLSAIVVLPFWFMMIFFPGRKWAREILKSHWIIVPPAICYALILFPNISFELTSFFLNPNPFELSKIMSQPWAASLFWAYAGAFDLFVGRWIFFDSQKQKNIGHLFIVPILIISVFFGPIGFLAYICLKLVKSPKTV